MGLLYGESTGAYRRDGTPHRQPTKLRQAWCKLRHGDHRCKFGAHPGGSCINCGYWPNRHWR